MVLCYAVVPDIIWTEVSHGDKMFPTYCHHLKAALKPVGPALPDCLLTSQTYHTNEGRISVAAHSALAMLVALGPFFYDLDHGAGEHF